MVISELVDRIVSAWSVSDCRADDDWASESDDEYDLPLRPFSDFKNATIEKVLFNVFTINIYHIRILFRELYQARLPTLMMKIVFAWFRMKQLLHFGKWVTVDQRMIRFATLSNSGGSITIL